MLNQMRPSNGLEFKKILSHFFSYIYEKGCSEDRRKKLTTAGFESATYSKGLQIVEIKKIALNNSAKCLSDLLQGPRSKQGFHEKRTA